jgi:transcriptional regulator with XRE-family HTH domain
MGKSRSGDDIDRKPAEKKQRKGLPTPDPRFVGLVAAARQRLGMSQKVFATAAGVSARTLTQVEANGKARAEIITKLAIAAGRSVEEWLTLSGHPVNTTLIDDVRIQQERAKNAQPIVRREPSVQFERMAKRVEEHHGALMCYIVTSDVQRRALYGRPLSISVQ